MFSPTRQGTHIRHILSAEHHQDHDTNHDTITTLCHIQDTEFFFNLGQINLQEKNLITHFKIREIASGSDIKGMS